MAISLDARKTGDFRFAAQFARKMAAFMMENPIPNIVMNVNVPALPEEEIKGVMVTKQGRARLVESFEKRVDPRDNIYYWLAGETRLSAYEEEDSDGSVLSRGMISITPIYFDLTRHDILDTLAEKIKRFF
jgi:5'-nucleotidase